MKSFAAILAALGFVASSAFAETAVKTEYFHQAPMDKNEGTAGLSYSDMKSKSKTAGVQDTTLTLMPLTLRYERGLTEEFSVGAELGYMISGKGKAAGDDYDVKGMSDLTVLFRGQHGIQSNMSVHYGIDLNASLGKNEVKLTGTDQTEATYQTGGMGMLPYVGMAYAMDAHIFGAKLSYGMDISKDKVDRKATTTTSQELAGGNRTELALFYETAVSGTIIGGELAYYDIGSVKTTTTSTTPNTETTTNGYYGNSLMVYAAHDLNETTTLLGNISYAMDKGVSTTNDSQNTWGLGVSGRFTF